MKQTFLDFEQPIAELQQKIDELRYVHEDSAVDISDEITRLTKKSQQLTKEIYARLTSWQIAQVARHPQRPYTLDYVSALFTDFRELHGDRTYADDPAIVGGLARSNGKPCMVIGQGGSGGALAIAIGDITLMLQYATYSVISPEGCASILWKSAEHAPEAAETLGITAPRLKQLGLIDKVVNEPLGGAHRDHGAMMVTLKKALVEALRGLQEQPLDALVEAREDKILGYGKFKEMVPS